MHQGSGLSLLLFVIVMEAISRWCCAVEEGFGLDVIYLDYKKAFDTVPHQKLLQKLKGLRLGDVLTKWTG